MGGSFRVAYSTFDTASLMLRCGALDFLLSILRINIIRLSLPIPVGSPHLADIRKHQYIARLQPSYSTLYRPKTLTS